MKALPMNRTYLALAAAAIGIAAALAGGYAAGGQAGLTDAAAVAAVGVLVVARGTLRGGKPGPVRPHQTERATTVSAEDFPAYRSIASDLEWGRLSWRHYQHAEQHQPDRLRLAHDDLLHLGQDPLAQPGGLGHRHRQHLGHVRSSSSAIIRSSAARSGPGPSASAGRSGGSAGAWRPSAAASRASSGRTACW